MKSTPPTSSPHQPRETAWGLVHETAGTSNPGNQITSTGYSYDAAGNLTHLPTGTALSYNTAGQRTSTTTTSTTTSYTYGGTGQDELLAQSAKGGDAYTYTYGRTDSSGEPEIENLTLTTGGNTYHAYVAHDPAGQPVALQTSTGATGIYVYDGRHNPVGLLTEYPSVAYLYQFDPYGTATTTENPGGTGYPQNPYVFAGGLQDRDTGLIRYGARWYNPTTGTWLEPDTLNAPLDPANANRYAYVGDDPINGVDPTGLVDCDVIGGGVGIASAAVGLLGGPVVSIGSGAAGAYLGAKFCESAGEPDGPYSSNGTPSYDPYSQEGSEAYRYSGNPYDD